MGQSELAPMNTPPWMDGVWTGLFFFIGFLFLDKIPVVEDSKCFPGVLNLGFIQLDDIKWEKGGVTFVGAGSHQPK
jgi:hypothetical protein